MLTRVAGGPAVVACNTCRHAVGAREDANGVREALVEQIAKPVRFADCVRSLVDAGCTDFLELGPGRVLTGLVRQVAGREVNAAAADSREKIEAFIGSRS